MEGEGSKGEGGREATEGEGSKGEGDREATEGEGSKGEGVREVREGEGSKGEGGREATEGEGSKGEAAREREGEGSKGEGCREAREREPQKGRPTTTSYPPFLQLNDQHANEVCVENRCTAISPSPHNYHNKKRKKRMNVTHVRTVSNIAFSLNNRTDYQFTVSSQRQIVQLVKLLFSF